MSDRLQNGGRALSQENYEAWFDYGDTLFELGYLKRSIEGVEPLY